MRRRDFLTRLTATALLPLYNNTAVANDQAAFAQYKQQQTQAFASYEAQLLEAFNNYKKLHDQAFKAYTQALAQRWSVVEISTPTQWVTYDGNLNTKLVMDFEQQTLKIESVLPPSPQQTAQIQALLQQVNQSTLQSLIQRDPVDRALNQFSLAENQKLAAISQQPPIPTPPPSLALTEKPLTIPNTLPKPKIIQTPKGQNLTQFVIPLESPTAANNAQQNLNAKEQRYLTQVQQQAQHWKIEPTLIMAITRTESAFNPLAKSHVPAFGLMQIVPRSAGMDASQLIYGQSRLVSPNYLYTPENNIQMGSAYLHILQYRYLKAIQHPQTKLYCSIAAYNTGAGNVARAMTGSTQLTALAHKVNGMQPQQVHDHLLNHLPHDETKHYLHRVLKAQANYQQSLQA